MTNGNAPGGPTRVAITIIRCGEKMLLVYNRKWRAFSFPMTKLRLWEHLSNPKGATLEERELTNEEQQSLWADAAAHAAVECLGKSNSPKPLLQQVVPMEYSDLERSGRDGAQRHYRYKVFELAVGQESEPLERPYEWLTPKQIRDGRRPISPTVLDLLGRREIDDIVKGWK